MAKASMGPGSFDPGNAAALAAGVFAVYASMGPGSFDPGNPHALGAALRRGAASMGPGSFDPGNRRPRQSRRAVRRRFNGAGVF